MSLLDALLLDPYRINVWIAKRTDGVAGTGTQNDPYDGSTAAKLDVLLNSLASKSRVHLGPGTFQTQGYFDGIAAGTGWQPKAGMKIVGSGVDVTTLQLANTSATNQHLFAIGHALFSSGPLVTAVSSLGSLRSNFDGWVGFRFQVGAAPITVTDLGRWVLSGNSGSHTVQLFNMDGTTVPGGSVSVNTSGQTAGQFAYATLPTPVTLTPNTTYAVMSLEVNGGDQWYDYGNTAITVSSVATLPAAVYSYPSPISIVGGSSGENKSYVPVSLRYSSFSVDFFEVSDLTIDCNLSGQSGSSVAAGAVRVLGNHTRVAKVSVINWGTKSADNTDQRKRQRANLES